MDPSTPHLSFDWTIHFGDFLLGVGGVFIVKVMLKQRDFYMEVTRILQGDDKLTEPGLLKRVSALEHDMYQRGGAVSRIHHWVNNLVPVLHAKGIAVPPRE